ncbi:AAA domain-containing protein [Rudanella lutea]|uniref:AAA domain-containing protein n=1 Tax=Rudanella lutea TaxID=451374 RepID=UPI0003764DE3|nr:AAA domain-containing protein [Rudanella lutea]
MIPNRSVLRTYRRRLTNLSSRNRSLLLSSLPADGFLDLHDTDFVLNKPSFSLIQQLLARKASIPLCDVLDPRHEKVNQISKRLGRIARTARFIEEERGTEDLYVGWPFVRGLFMDGTPVHAPLLFFPVQIEHKGDQWHLTRRGDEEGFVNPTFMLAYAHFNAVKLPGEYIEKELDEFDKDSLTFRTQLYEWLKASPLKINFNQDLFVDLLRPFDKVTQKTLHALEKTGELKLYPEAVLGIFPQAGSFLVPDYDALLTSEESETQNPVEAAAIPSLTPLSPPPAPYALKERFLRTPLPMDASQEAAVRAVKGGESLVVQGPPGTGKSQLIANLMADAAAEGKRVLLVCQKRAALDVVFERLKQVGMEPFIALIHDFQDDRKALYAQIAGQIEAIDRYRQQNHGLDAVLIERDFDRESRQIDELLDELETFKHALFDTTECGVSAKELYLNTNPEANTIKLDDLYPHFQLNNVDNFIQRLRHYTDYQQRLGPNHPWNDRVSFASFSTTDQFVLDRAVAAVGTVSQQTASVAATHGIQSLSLDTWRSWHESAWALEALLSLLNDANSRALWTAVLFLREAADHPAATVAEGELLRLANRWEEALTAPGPLVLPTEQTELDGLAVLLNSAIDARPSWVSWNWWQLTNPGKDKLLQLAGMNGLTTSADHLRTLQARLQKRQALNELAPFAEPLLASLPLAYEPETLRLLQDAREVVARMADLPVLTQLPAQHWISAGQFAQTVRALRAQADEVANALADWQPFLTSTQIEILWANQSHADTLRRALRADFDLLIENDRLWAQLSEVEQTVAERLATHTEANPTGIVALFMNSLQLAWLNHLEQKYPSLRSVSSLRMSQQEQALQTSIEQKQRLSRDILLMQLRQQTYRNLTFNRLNNVTTYRDLLHQTTKKRNVWPVRRLMSQFAIEVFRLVPCWMASPESVSAIFPLQEGLFDLVIFDEASQCFAENGVPAMIRGKQVVVTGDNQQLRPSDLYRTRMDDETAGDEADQTALEVESLLELAAQSLPQVSLTGHYRSRSLDLIQFSNEHFYGNKLTLLPDRPTLNRQIPAIRYLLVGGQWQQNTNPVEAEAVLQRVRALATEQPGKSVGVVTFNYPQQQLIQDQLEEAHLPVAFVKNIENVQGDECDVIIFSVGYAPDERGRLAMQFGSLNQAGGANRLNVAVTRAREQVYVITSLRPEQLSVETVANDGPRLLKAYLHYAQRVSAGEFRPQPRPVEGLRPEGLLKSQLSRRHPNWQPELPVADLTVREGDAYTALILTDDDQYYRQTVKEAHALLPFALRDKQWPYERHWSREFWKNNAG